MQDSSTQTGHDCEMSLQDNIPCQFFPPLPPRLPLPPHFARLLICLSTHSVPIPEAVRVEGEDGSLSPPAPLHSPVPLEC